MTFAIANSLNSDFLIYYKIKGDYSEQPNMKRSAFLGENPASAIVPGFCACAAILCPTKLA
jgi:hypothetical protein